MTANTVGFVGAGFHAQTNLLPAASLAGVGVAGLASRNAERSAAALARHGLTGRGYGSLAGMLREQPAIDRVIVCAQPEDQPAIVRQLLEAGIHVLAEKPLGTDAGEARSLAELARANGAVLRVGFMKRHAPAVLKLRELLETMAIGPVLSFEIAFGADASSFAPSPTDFIRLAAIHHIDLLRFLLGEPERVEAELAETGGAHSILVTVRMASGGVGTLRLSNAPGHTSEVDHVAITCEHGTLTMTDTRDITIRRPTGPAGWQELGESTTRLHPSISTMSGGAQDLTLRGFVDEIRAFATDTLADDAGDDCAAESNARTMGLVGAIVRRVEAARNGGRRPAIAFGTPGPVRDAMNTAILAGEKTSSSNLLLAYEATGEQLPTAGEIRHLLDSDDRPIASLRFSSVAQRLLGDVDAELAALEGMTLAEWQRGHREFWATLVAGIRAHTGVGDWVPSDDDVVVTTVFRATPLGAESTSG